MTDAKGWALEIDADWAAIQDDLTTAVVRLALDAVVKVNQKSPVGNPDIWATNIGKVRNGPGWHGRGYVGGHFRRNWTLTIGAPDFTIFEGEDPSGGATVAKNSAVMDGYPSDKFPVIYLQNNLPYAERLETGYSTQAPGGMVALTMGELAALWEATEI